MILGNLLRRPSWKKFRVLAVIIIVLGIFYGLFIWKLGSLTPGLSPAEASARAGSNLHSIIDNPINAPQRLVQLTLHRLSPKSIYLLRLASVLWTGVYILCFYKLARRWFGKTVGALGTILFASTPWFVLSARNADPTIMLLMPLAIAACFVWAIKCKNHVNLAAIILAATVAIGFYTPGTLWFLIVSTYFARKQLLAFMTRVGPIARVLCAIIFLCILAPLVRAVILDWTVIKPLLLIPATFAGVFGIAKAFAWSSLALVWRTQRHLDISIGRWPMLNVVQSVLLIFGVFAMFAQALSVGCMLAIFAGLCLFAAAINNNLSLAITVLPVLSIFVAAGLRYLYIEWRTIFPRNPLPRALAISLMVALATMQLFFSVRYALVAWPHTPDTLRLYVLK
jgi:hypothetical protein